MSDRFEPPDIAEVIACGHCGMPITVDETTLGRMIECPGYGRYIPAASERRDWRPATTLDDLRVETDAGESIERPVSTSRLRRAGRWLRRWPRLRETETNRAEATERPRSTRSRRKR